MAKYSQYRAAAGTVKEVLPIFLIFSKRAGEELTRIIMQNAMIRRQKCLAESGDKRGVARIGRL